MLNMVNLKLFPSCYDCLSWSADGELAVAAGEYIHVLVRNPVILLRLQRLTTIQTPAKGTQRAEDPRMSGSQWHSSRFRANVFTINEWPTIDPQDRQTLSIGAEQSLSTVVSLAWSPPGIARHRRCTLGVLTSNLVLSLFEPVGPQGKWLRVAVVNWALSSYFQQITDEESLRLRKALIRSFTWCPPVKVPVSQKDCTPYSVLDTESRWGVQLLAVSNDDNDVVFLQTQRSRTESRSSNPYAIELLTVAPLHHLVGNYSMMQPHSVFSTALKPRIRALHISCGPWLRQTAESQPGSYSLTNNVAVVYGTKLKIVRLNLTLIPQNNDPGMGPRYKSVASFGENIAICKNHKGDCQVTGPFRWMHTDGSEEVLLAAGVFAGLVMISIPTSAYLGDDTGKELQTKEWPFHDNTVTGEQTDETRHWEPISAMSVALNEKSQQSALYFGTSGGYGATKEFNDLGDQTSLSLPPWKASFYDYCEQFDIDRDLGGMVTGTIWGLACHDGVIATAFTMHPKDLVEYRTAAEERTVITFTPLDSRHDEGDTGLSQEVADHSPEFLRTKREAILGYILHAEQGLDGSSSLSKKVIYAAACCAIHESENEELLDRAKMSLEWLATATGTDLNEEGSKCSPGANTIEPKSTEQLQGPGVQIFEQCDMCDAGVAWDSAREAQCVNGHLFARCNLTFLSIQEPGVSKFCSQCEAEYLDQDSIGSSYGSDLLRTSQTLSDAFDVCIYCGGKFRS